MVIVDKIDREKSLDENIEECERQWFEEGGLSCGAFEYMITQIKLLRDAEDLNELYWEAMNKAVDAGLSANNCEEAVELICKHLKEGLGITNE